MRVGGEAAFGAAWDLFGTLSPQLPDDVATREVENYLCTMMWGCLSLEHQMDSVLGSLVP